MSHDPWMEDSNSLDLTDNVEDRVHVPFAFTRDHAEWLTADGQANFARGTEASVTQSQANAETAVKVAGATAKHCIVIHGVSTFLSGEGRNLDYDQECFT